MIFLFSILSVAWALPSSPLMALNNAHESSVDAFARELQNWPYKNFILSSYVEPLLQNIDKSWAFAYTQNDASLFLQEFLDFVGTRTEQLVIEMSDRYQECRLFPASNLEKRRLGLPHELLDENALDGVEQILPPSVNNVAHSVEDIPIHSAPWSKESFTEGKNVVEQNPTEASKPEYDASFKECFTDVVKAIKKLFSTLAQKTGCVAIVGILGYVLIGSVLLAYMVTFVLFGLNFAKYLLSKNTRV